MKEASPSGEEEEDGDETPTAIIFYLGSMPSLRTLSWGDGDNASLRFVVSSTMDLEFQKPSVRIPPRFNNTVILL